jgi:dihydrolipoamide dehydrogenase
MNMADKNKFDLIVVGAGPGGYVAAVRAAQLGMKVACVDKRPRLGGVCLNEGCIPSKALLDSSEYFHLASEEFAAHGIGIGPMRLDLATMMARKDQVVTDLTDNVRKLLVNNKIEIIQGTASLAGDGQLKVGPPSGKGRKKTFKAGAIMLATGSETISLPKLTFDKNYIVDAGAALKFESVPKHLGIVGGGYIGLEIGSIWLRLGAKVTVIEMLPHVAASTDSQIGRRLERLLKKQGMAFELKTSVTSARVKGAKVEVSMEKGGKSAKASFDKLLVAVGRKPLTDGLGLKNLGVDANKETGRIVVDEKYETSVAGVYAIGDLVEGPMLAHKASAEGVAAAECIAGRHGEVNYDAIPSVIYTAPEVASVGLTEDQAKAREIPYCVGAFPFAGTGRARCMGLTDGLVKLVVHSQTDRLLGAHIIGPRAADMIAECVLALEFGASSEDIARTVHGHPTFSEALQEAALSARACSIYAS